MTSKATPAEVGSSDQLGLPLEDALKRAYYYTEAGDWRGPEVDEWDRWHAVAKIAAEQVAAERERICAEIILADKELLALADAVLYEEPVLDAIGYRQWPVMFGRSVVRAVKARMRENALTGEGSAVAIRVAPTI